MNYCVYDVLCAEQGAMCLEKFLVLDHPIASKICTVPHIMRCAACLFALQGAVCLEEFLLPDRSPDGNTTL
jgi:hypothetical protein